MEKQRNLFDDIEKETLEKKEIFLKHLESSMQYKSDFAGDSLDFEWLDQIEFACPYIDNVVRRPKLALIKEERVVKVEKSKKITVESVKDLSRHTNFISKFDKKSNSVEPSKILNVFSEETFNIYENRFLYTLINDINNFIYKKELELKNLEIIDNKNLEYKSETVTDREKVSIELRVTSESFPSNKADKKLAEQIKSAKVRIKRVKDYLSSWSHSELVKELDKAHVNFINPPIKKTNIILKNPNFQIAVKLWDWLYKYETNDNNSKDDLEKNEINPIQAFLDHSFLIDYCVLDSITKSKREQKQKMAKYAILILTQEIERTISLLMSCGYKIDDEQLLGMISKELKKSKSNRLVGADDVKKKFKSAMDEYLERTQDYL